MIEIKQTTQNLIVTRDGLIDEEAINLIIAAERRELLKQYGQEALVSLTHSPVVIGRAIIRLFNTIDEGINGTTAHLST